MVAMMPPDMREGEPAHEGGELMVVSWPQNQVPVIGHETPAEQFDAVSLKRFAQHEQKCLVIFGLLEDLHPAVAAIDHVINFIGESASRRTGHV